MPLTSYNSPTFSHQLKEQQHRDSSIQASDFSPVVNAISSVTHNTTSQYFQQSHNDDHREKQQIPEIKTTIDPCHDNGTKTPPTSHYFISTNTDQIPATQTSTTSLASNNQEEACDNESPRKLVNDIDDDVTTKLVNSSPDVVTILHFNDCYNIEPGPHSSGAAGFLTAINQYRHLNPMILFSGDIMSPSFISTFTKGEQMIPVLNDIGVHCAVFGNHEFDYGVDNLIEFVKQTSFPWLLSNVVDKETSNQLGDGKIYHIIETGGLKFGLIGLIEEEWLSTLSTIDSCDVIYEDFVTKGRALAIFLKSDPHNVDYVIALTHFRKPNDIRLADNVPEIDLILGGHDHDYEIINRPNAYIIKSGTDFREFSLITLKINPDYVKQQSQKHIIEKYDLVEEGKVEGEDNRGNGASSHVNIIGNLNSISKPIKYIDIERVSCFGYPQNEELNRKLDKFVKSIDEKMGKVLGQFSCDLDGRFASIRNYETNLGNFVTDIMLASTHADLAILNSGTLRSDQIHPKGDFTMRDLFKILGFIDPIAVLNASGFQIWKALENGVCQWPKLEGRFPQVSGCSFIFDPNKPALQRIDPKDIFIGDEQLQLDKQYKLTTKDYLAAGKDGYDILKECEVLLPGDESPDLTTSILNHFEAINIIKSNRRTRHRQSIICLSRNSIKKMLHSQNSSEVVDYQNLANDNIINTREQTSSGIEEEPDEEEKKDDKQSDAADGLQTLTSTLKNATLMDDNNNRDNTTSLLPETGIESAIISPSIHPNELANQNDTNIRDNNKDNANDEEIDLIMDESLDTFEAGLPQINNIGYSPQLASSPLIGTVAPKPKLVANSPKASTSITTKSINKSPETPVALSIIDGVSGTYRQPRSKRLMSLDDLEHEQCKLNPQIEGRIKIVGIHITK